MSAAELISLSSAEVAAYYAFRVPGLAQQGREWRGPCPLHNGQRDSFSVSAESGLWHCHSECDRGGDVFDFERALASVDFPEAKRTVLQVIGRSDGRSPGRRRLAPQTAEYFYRGADGAAVLRVTRHQEPGSREKAFVQWRPNGRGWKAGITDRGRLLVPLVPFRLPELLAAPAGDPLFVTEGEKACEAVALTLGLTATTAPQGAGKWPRAASGTDRGFRAEVAQAFNEHFRGRDVVILPDNDEAGSEHACQVARALAGIAASVRVLRLPDLAHKGDAYDWISAGGTREAMLALAVDAPDFEPDAALPAEAGPFRVGMYEATAAGISMIKSSRDGGETTIPLTNFDCTIRAETAEDDGAEEIRLFDLEAAAMAGYIRWLAPRYPELLAGAWRERRDAFRAQMTASHARTPDAMANLALGWWTFLAFAQDAGALSTSEASDGWGHVWSTLADLAGSQSRLQAENNPVRRFLELLAEALASGKAHLADREGDRPGNGPGGTNDQARACGWRQEAGTWKPLGVRIGWLDGANLYLLPDASHTVALDVARGSTESLAIGVRTLGKRLHEAKKLVSVGSHNEPRVARRFEGSVKRVLNLHADALSILPVTATSATEAGDCLGEAVSGVADSETGSATSATSATPCSAEPDAARCRSIGNVADPSEPIGNAQNHRATGISGNVLPMLPIVQRDIRAETKSENDRYPMEDVVDVGCF